MTDEGGIVESENQIVIMLSQQCDDGGPPAGLGVLELEENRLPCSCPGTQPAPGDGKMEVGIPVESAPVSMQSTEYPDIKVFAFGPAKQDIGGTGKEFIEQPAVVAENLPERVG